MLTTLMLSTLLACPTQVLPENPMGGGTQSITVPLATNQSCTLCHAGDNPQQSSNSYRGTMMDQAGRDPIFLASLEVAYNDDPAATELCVRCHYPRGWLAGRGRGAPEDNYGLRDSDYDGVECDFCHRMEVPDPIANYQGTVPPAPLSGVLQENSQVFLRNGTDKSGPIGSDLTIGHSSEYSELMTDSVMCAQCHDVSNTFLERRNLDGTASGTIMPFERTYSEWRDSDFSDPNNESFASCQQCHMKRFTGNAASQGSSGERELANHMLVGANTIAPRMVSYLNPELDLTTQANVVADEARRLLREESAVLEALTLEDTADGPALKVRTTNITGHKLPTGYAEGRRMFLSHRVDYADGTQGPRSGQIDLSTASFIPDNEPVKTYEILLSGGASAGHNFHLITVDQVLKDNRIPPKGFRPNVDTAPVNALYEEVSPGVLANYDDTLMPLGDVQCWPAIVRVRLEFQEVTGEYFRFLRDNAPLYGPTLEDAWTRLNGGQPTIMQEVNVAVHFDGRVESPRPEGYACSAPPPVVVEPPPPGEEEPPRGVTGVGCSQSVSSASFSALLIFTLALTRRKRFTKQS